MGNLLTSNSMDYICLHSLSMVRRNRMSGGGHWHRRDFIGGSDARIIMGGDEAALIHLWREKRGEAEPEDLSGNLIVQLGKVTEDLNRTWYERPDWTHRQN